MCTLFRGFRICKTGGEKMDSFREKSGRTITWTDICIIFSFIGSTRFIDPNVATQHLEFSADNRIVILHVSIYPLFLRPRPSRLYVSKQAASLIEALRLLLHDFLRHIVPSNSSTLVVVLIARGIPSSMTEILASLPSKTLCQEHRLTAKR